MEPVWPRPGGNVTGLSYRVQDEAFDAKRLEMLKEVLPTISHVAVLWTTVHPSHQYELKSIAGAARRLGVGNKFRRDKSEWLELAHSQR